MAVGIQKAWSVTAASNQTADTNINLTEGGGAYKAPDVNDTQRAIMAAIKALTNQIAGAKDSGGSANAYTFTSDAAGAVSTSYARGMSVAFKANHSCSGASTLNVDAVGATAIRKGGAETALATGDIVANGVYRCTYNGTYWIIENPDTVGAYQPLDATLTAFAALTTADNTMLDFTGVDTMAVVAYATVATNLGLSSSDSPQFAGVNIGHASDSTLTRASAGKIAVEGVTLADLGSAAQTLTGDIVLADAAPSSALSIGFRGAPVVDGNSAYAFPAADAGKSVYHDEAGTRTYTIPANASVAHPVGTVFIIDNTGNSGAPGAITLAITSDTLRRGDGTAGTGSRTIPASGVAVVRKVAATVWVITGAFT